MLPRSRIRKTDHHEPPSEQKIDRLSSLPPELLDYIFDLAYPLGSPSTGPLSKHLLHYHILGLYRRIDLEDGAQVVALSQKVEDQPELGELVKVARFRSYGESDYLDEGEVNSFLGSNLPNLVELDLGDELNDTFQWIFSGLDFPYCGSIRHLRLAGLFCLVDLIQEMPSLEILEVKYDHESIGDDILLCCYNQHCHECSLKEKKAQETLRKLSIEGDPRAGSAQQFASFFSLYPNLTDLTLTFDEDFIGESVMSNLVPLLPTNLVKLSLRCKYNDHDRFIDHFLPAFTDLRHLHLGTSLFSPNLPSHLSQLHSLETLELKYGKISLSQLLPLLSGPSRLKSLESLNLDLIRPGRVGKTMIDERGKLRRKLVPVDDRKFTADGWELPDFDVEGGLVTLEGTKSLLRLAKEARIECEGTLFEALDAFESYAIEAANVAVYRTHRDRDLRHIDRLKAQHPQLSRFLPPVDFKSLQVHVTPQGQSIFKLGALPSFLAEE
ncbi:hypothetical protein JCM3765_007180 [Sporobolomyces pararoseus]